MDPRKNVSKVSAGETVKHTGDLTIDGDIGEHSVIEVTDGVLSILGNINNGANIKLTVSEEMRNKLSINNNNGISSINYSGGVSIRTGTINIRGGGQGIRANNCISIGNKSFYSKGVNINNRITTDDVVTELDNGAYEIVSPSEHPYASMFGGGSAGRVYFDGVLQVPKKSSKHGYAMATIDGKTYEGKKIVVDRNYNVLVDGKDPNAVVAKEKEKQVEEAPKTPPKLVIQGHIGNHVIINADADIDVHDFIGEHCKIQSHYGSIKAKNILPHTHVKARDELTVDNIGSHCHLTSEQDKLTTGHLEHTVRLTASDGVTINGAAAHSCTVNSSMGGLHARSMGDKAAITVREHAKVTAVLGAESIVNVSQSKFTGETVGNRTRITARDGIHAKVIGDNVNLNVSMGKVIIDDRTGQHATISGRDGVVVGSVGGFSGLTSSMGHVKVSTTGSQVRLIGRDGVSIDQFLGTASSVDTSMGKVSAARIESNTNINARDGVHISSIGDNATINVSMGKATVGDVGRRANIDARDGINVEGRCPQSANLSSSMGKVMRSQPVYDDYEEEKRLAVEKAIADALAESERRRKAAETALQFERDTQKAMAISQTDVLKQQGVFAQSVAVSTNAASSTATMTHTMTEIPEAYICPITQSVMEDPYIICDGSSYEKAAIMEWLDKHHTSPLTRLPVESKAVFPNRALKDAIDDFRKNNPQLFLAQNNSNTM